MYNIYKVEDKGFCCSKANKTGSDFLRRKQSYYINKRYNDRDTQWRLRINKPAHATTVNEDGVVTRAIMRNENGGNCRTVVQIWRRNTT